MSGAALARDFLLALLDQAFDRPSWHGTNLRGSLRRLDPEVAAWRPGPERHNAWELIVHCAYWKYAVWRRFGGAAAAAPTVFAEPAGKGRFSVREWVTGIAAHDLYHAGQVQLLKRLAAPTAETGA